MKKIYILLFAFLIQIGLKAQTVSIAANPGTSGNIIVGGSSYHASESIYTDAEIGATNFVTSALAINKIGFNVFGVGAPSAISSFKLWMKNVPAATTIFASGVYNTTGYTLVYSGAIDPAALGLYEINLTTSFTRTAGSNLQLLIERLDGGTHTGASFYSANGNQSSSTALTSRRYNGTTALAPGTTSLTTTAFRPSIVLVHTFPTDAAASGIVNPSVSCYSANQSIGIVVSNAGTASIAGGAVTVSLRVRGANTFTGSANNTGVILPGATETVTFNGINLNNTGVNYDTAFVTIAGDGSATNDTLKATTTTASVISALPIIEDAEGTPLAVFPYAKAVVGASQYWQLHSGNYKNTTTATDSLIVRTPGTKFYLFDSYNATLGSISRLYSNCIQLPSTSGNTSQISFWMSHDSAYATDLDSMYVNISTDKGLTWSRLTGFQRSDAAATAYYWKKDSVDLTAYNGQLVQLGFEGVGAYGNAFGLDDINISSISGTPCTPTNNSTTQTACNSYLWQGNNYTTSGVYTFSYTNGTGCASVDTLHLTINPTPIVNSVSNQTVCSGTSTTAVVFTSTVPGTTYSWINNNTSIGLAASGTGNIASFATIAAGVSTIAVTPTANGCNGAILSFTITVSASPSVTNQTVTSCSGDMIMVTPTGASTGTVYSWSTPVVTGGINGGASGTNQATIMNTLVNTTAAAQTATYTITPNVNGCSGATFTLVAIVKPIPNVNVVSNQAKCNGTATTAITFVGAIAGTVYNWSNTTTSIGLAASGTGNIASFIAINTTASPMIAIVTVTPTANGCTGNAMTFTITVNPTINAAITQVACVSYVWHGTTYTVSGNYTYTNTGTCLTVDTLHLTINQPSSSAATPVLACSSYSWNGTTYTTSGTYTWTGTNAVGCDSVATLNLTINQPVTPTFTQVAAICSGSTFALPSTSNNSIAGTWAPAINNTATTAYTFTPASGACATTATMTVTVNQPTVPTFTQVAAICTGGSFTLPATSNNSISGIWTPAINNTATTAYTFTPSAGCNSTATMTVTVNQLTTPTFTQVPAICSGSSFTLPATSNNTINGTWTPAINNTATTTYTFTSAAGQCANNTTMTVTVKQPSSSTATPVTACNSYSWNGTSYTTSGTKTFTTTNAAGCDSVVTLNLTINQSSSSSVTVDTSASYGWHGMIYSTTGTYVWTGTNAVGCDSIVTLHLTVRSTSIVYPNPSTNGKFNVNLSSFNIVDLSTKGLQVIVYDASGKIVLSQKLTNTNTELNINKNAKGIYFIKIRSTDNSIKYATKIMKAS